MSTHAAPDTTWTPARARPRAGVLTLGISTIYLSLIVLIPIAAVVAEAFDGGWAEFWSAVTNAEAVSTLKLTFGISFLVVAINAVSGTLIAWVLVRDPFRGKSIVNAIIDLPFALPTIVAGLTLLACYGPQSPFGINIAFTRIAVALALLFVTLPFVVRAVQPVLLELDREMEEAATSLGASPVTTFRRVVLPNLMPAILSGTALGFGRAIGEFGSVILISGNIPHETEVTSWFIFESIESDDPGAAASVSVVLLACSLLVLIGADLIERHAARPDAKRTGVTVPWRRWKRRSSHAPRPPRSGRT